MQYTKNWILHFNWVNFMCIMSQIKIFLKSQMGEYCKWKQEIIVIRGNDKVADLKIKNIIWW